MPDEVAELAGRLFDWARRGNPTLLDYIDQGVPVDLANQDGNTFLMLAAYSGHAELLTGLVERGADVNKLNDRGQSPLAGALFKKEEAVVAELLRAGADPDAGTPSARETAAMFGAVLPLPKAAPEACAQEKTPGASHPGAGS